MPSNERAGAPSKAVLLTVDPRFAGTDHGSSVVARVETQMSWLPIPPMRPVTSDDKKISRPSDEAIAELQKTLAISPREDNALRRIAEARAYQGRFQDGLKILSQVDPDANPPFWHSQMALVLLHLGRRDSAFALIRNYLRAHPEDRGGVVTSARAVWFALRGDAHRAAQDIQTAVQKGKGYIHFHHAGYHIALAYALLQLPDSAVRWLRQVAEDGFPCYPLFEREPFLDNVRTDPGFVAFMREQKVQWEHFRATL